MMRRLIVPLSVVVLTLGAACTEDGGTGAPPEYELLLSPPSLSVFQGASPTVSVTISRNNFNGGVALFLTGAPANVTGSFVPGTTNGSASTLTVTVGGSVTPGTYNLIVNGNGAPGPRMTTLPLTVAPAPSFTLEMTPPMLSIARGSSDSSTLTITRSNFAGVVALGLTGAPLGVTSAFVPATPTGSTSVLTITVGAGATPGTYSLTVEGSGTAGNRTAPLTLTIT